MIKLNLPVKNMRFREKLAFFTPQKYKNFLKKQMIYAGVREAITNKFIGFSFFFTIALGFVTSFDLWRMGFGLMGIHWHRAGCCFDSYTGYCYSSGRFEGRGNRKGLAGCLSANGGER